MGKLITTLLCSVMLLCNAAYGFSQNYDVRTKSDITAAQLDSKLKNKLKGMGEVFVSCQEKYGVNAVFLAAIAIHESGNGSIGGFRFFVTFEYVVNAASIGHLPKDIHYLHFCLCQCIGFGFFHEYFLMICKRR